MNNMGLFFEKITKNFFFILGYSISFLLKIIGKILEKFFLIGYKVIKYFLVTVFYIIEKIFFIIFSLLKYIFLFIDSICEKILPTSKKLYHKFYFFAIIPMGWYIIFIVQTSDATPSPIEVDSSISILVILLSIHLIAKKQAISIHILNAFLYFFRNTKIKTLFFKKLDSFYLFNIKNEKRILKWKASLYMYMIVGSAWMLFVQLVEGSSSTWFITMMEVMSLHYLSSYLLINRKIKQSFIKIIELDMISILQFIIFWLIIGITYYPEDGYILSLIGI